MPETRRAARQAIAILCPMFARRLKVDVIIDGQRKPCPLEWLDSFSMRNFTNAAEFDDTLPTGEGTMEVSLRVTPERFAAALAEFLNKRGKADGKEVEVICEQTN